MTATGVTDDLRRVARDVDSAVFSSLGAEWFAAHTQPERHYHTVDHARFVRDDVARWAPVAGLADEPAALVCLAAWYHDVIYECSPGADETASAEMLADALVRVGRADLADRGRSLVMVTTGHEPSTVAEAVLVDADLGVLAGTPEQYERYRFGVRREYAHVDDEAWRVGRAAVLRSLLDRPALFHGPAAPTREPAARANLTTELHNLEKLSRFGV